MAQEYTPVFYHNFTKSFDVNSFENKISCDGQLTRDVRGLTINTNKFNSHVNPGPNGLLDHIKWLAFLRKSYQICEGEFIYEACIAAQQLISPNIVPNIYRNRIRNIHEDYRLCSSGLVVYDEESMITAKILFTNDWIYGYYERRPGYKTGWSINNNPSIGVYLGDYAAFTSIIPLCKRGSFAPMCSNGVLDDFVRVGIGIDPQKGTIKFYVNRVELFCIPRIGYRLADQYQVIEYGGVPYLTVPGCLRFGFGHFSYLDHNIPNNYAREYVVNTLDSNGFPVHRLSSGLAQLLPTDKYREPYPDFTGEYTSIDPNISFAYSGTGSNFFNFGQGMITKIKYIAGYVVNNRIKIHKMMSNKCFICNDQSELISSNITEKVSSDSDELSQSNKISNIDNSDYLDDLYGPNPKISRTKNPHPLTYSLDEESKLQSISQSFDSMRALLIYAPKLPSNVPLYRDVSNKPSLYSQPSDGSRLSYSLGDLYKKSRTRQFITKGESEEKDKIIQANPISNNDEIEQIIFSTNDMTLYI
jgi:hypothetical protein